MKRILSCVNWPETFPDKPYVEVELENCGDCLKIHYLVREELTMAAAQQDFDQVWNDSCCELFIRFGQEEKYYNLETSCNGCALLAWRSGRDDPEDAPASIMNGIVRKTSLERGVPFGETHVDEWTLELEVPVGSFWHSSMKSLHGVRISGNIYKCNSGMERQHYLSLFPIDTPEPDFHRPEYFKKLDI